MKRIKHLRVSWFALALVAAVVAAHFLATLIRRELGVHVSGVALAAISVGLIAALIAQLYDGVE